jgi:hypothetical protein
VGRFMHWASCAGVLGLLSLGSCTEEGSRTPTQVMLEIDAEEGVAARAAKLRVRVEGGSGIGALTERVERLDELLKPVRFPQRVALVPLEEDAKRAFVVTATAYDSEGAFLSEARIISSYVPGQVRYARLLVEARGCLRLQCRAEDQTCSGGACVDASVDVRTFSRDRGEPTLVNIAAGTAPIDEPEVDAGCMARTCPDSSLVEPSMAPDAGKDSGGDATMTTTASDVGADAAAQSAPAPVDLLFVIDNSGSMAEEQKKLDDVLDNMVRTLTTGYLDPNRAQSGYKTDFAPVQSLHIGVVSSDMGLNGAPPQKSCGSLSFKPTERDTFMATAFSNKPLGDDGWLLTSADVAVDGIWVAPTLGASPELRVPGDPACRGISFPAGERFVNFKAGVTNPNATALSFRCIAKLGKNGCGMEQQLESALKALTPPDSPIKFSASASDGIPTAGQGTAINSEGTSGPNRGFLRDDSFLAVVFVTDEEDCSSPDRSNAIFNPQDTSVSGEINVRCGLTANRERLHPVQRYIDGLRALKPTAYQDRIIVAAIVGAPTRLQLGTSSGAVSGAAAIQALLARPDMRFQVRRNGANTADEPVPTCVSPSGAGSAAPARRFLELAEAFGSNGVVTSICEDEYGSALQVLIDKITR